jgi:hypothetical protein
VSRIKSVDHEFVQELPDAPREGVLYVAMAYATALHLCCCGCANPVYTPLRPNRWRLTFDGETISLAPSIGNWNFPCEAHYWITGSRVRWAPAMTRPEIDRMRMRARVGSALTDGGEQSPAPEAAGRIGAARRRLRRLLSASRDGHRS